MGQQVIRQIFDLPQGGHGGFEVAGVPKDDRSDEQVEAGSGAVGSRRCGRGFRWRKTARARLLRDSPLLSSWPVERRSSGSSIQSGEHQDLWGARDGRAISDRLAG